MFCFLVSTGDNLMKKPIRLIGLIGTLALLAAVSILPTAHGQTYTVLHTFNGTDGNQPYDTFALNGTTLYGATFGIGSNDGSIFSININGTGFQNLMTFNGTSGSRPNDLTRIGSTLYGTTVSPFGSNLNNGTLFSINTSGTGFQTLYTGISGGPGDLILGGSTLYGTTGGGGSNGNGSIFSINTDGTGFQTLLSFSGTGLRGPSSLVLSGSTLYGTTGAGGKNNDGGIFSINTDVTGFQTLLSFSGTGGAAPGSNPQGLLTLSGSTLYGTTGAGGNNNDGTVFSINTDGTDFQNLLSFSGTGGAVLGSNPECALTLIGSTLYGSTVGGGSNNDGVVFSLTLPSPTPEPSTLTLLGSALVGFGVVYLRRRNVVRRTTKPSAFDQQDAPTILAFSSHSSTASAARRAA